MKRLLDDYIFDDTLRYEGHKLIYRDADGMEIVLGGMMGAAVLCTLLDNTDEGDARGIAIDSEAQRAEFFNRYEREVRRDNGGLFTTEVEALSNAYMKLAGSDALLRICRNDRLFDLAFGLVVDYMQRLVIEQVCPHIYDAVPWRMPFAQWLFDAGYAETMRGILSHYSDTKRISIHGYSDEGSTTTPLDELARNNCSRYDIAADILERTGHYEHVEKYRDYLAENAFHASLTSLDQQTI